VTLEELANRLDDLVSAVERIADALDDVTAGGRVEITGKLVTAEDRP
jgi:antitoxin (DNA-binding transcriptional repressor) of toxin-antitoxin stability system